MGFAPQRRTLCRHLNFQKWSKHLAFFAFWLENVLRATTAYTLSTSQLLKVIRTCCSFCAFWLENVLRATTAYTLSTSQLLKVIRTCCFFVHFDLEMCFAPQRRTLFRHLNFKKWSEHVVFLYSLTWKWALDHNSVHFFDISTSKSGPNVRCFSSKCALRHNRVHFFISHLATWLRARRSSEPTVRLSGATNHRENRVNRDFPTFSRPCFFFLLSLSPLWTSHCFSSLLWLFPPPLFHLSILSEVWLLNFLRLYRYT